MSIHALTERAMVANLSLSIWQGYRLDKEASRKVTKGANAKEGTANVNKHLVPKEILNPIVQAQGALRTHFYTNTMPWRDNGDRILPRGLYTKFIQEHAALKTEFDRVVTHFIEKDYPGVVEQAEFRMGELFKPDDYPRGADLRRKFDVRLDFDAVTTSGDFRVQIDKSAVDSIRAGMEAAAEERIKAAMGDVWSRIGKAVGAFHDRMANPEAVFRDSTIENVHELIGLLPGLNMLDNPDITLIHDELVKLMTGVSASEIRKDDELRGSLAEGAQEVLDRMAGFMRAFGG